MIALLAGTLGVLGCDTAESTGNDAGTGGADGGTGGTGGTGGGTAGTGGGGTMCDATVEEVCAECDVPSAAPNCEATYNTCLADPVTVNPCESCALLGLADCGP